MSTDVTVVVTMFNSEAFIERALESIRTQTMERFEVIVVDDGSDHACGAEFAAEFLESWGIPGRVVVQRNRGPSAARNRGLANARGRYIAFLDSDDTWFPDNLENQVRLLGSLPASYACVAGAFMRGTGKLGQRERIIYQDCMDGWLDISAYLEGKVSIEGTPSFMYRREYLEDVRGFDQELRNNEDFDLLIRIAGVGKIKTHRELTFKQFVREGSLSQADPVSVLTESLKFADKVESTCTDSGGRLAAGLRQRAYFAGARRFLQSGEVARFAGLVQCGVNETGWPRSWRGWVAYSIARVVIFCRRVVRADGRTME